MTHEDGRPTGARGYLRERELAARWGTSRRTLQRWRALGLGPAYLRIGGAIRYAFQDVLDYERSVRSAGGGS